MIHNLKPYPAYKDSGVPWLGKVPEHWEIRRLKHTSTLHGRIGFHGLSSSDYGSDGIIVVSGSNFRDWYVNWNQCNRIAEDWYEKDKNIQLRNGDLLVTKDGTIGKTAIVKELTEKAVLNSGVIVVRPKIPIQYENRYLLYLINSKVFDTFIDIKKTGATINHLYEATFHNFSISLPPLSEQSAIVRYLDHIDRRIRRYIRAKQKLIKLLEEKKQAIIHQAVTRGLDPNVKLKPSGVEWLGEVPEHWNKVPLKFLSLKIQNGATPPTSDQSFYADGIIPWFGPSSIGADIKIGNPVRYLPESAFAAGKARLIQGPAILVIVIGATAGRMALFVGEGSTNQQLTTFELRDGGSYPEFVIHQLRSAELWLRSTASTATIPILNSGIVSRLIIALPALEEQKAICERITGLLRPFDVAIDRAHHEISLLHEYRIRLIADVVTGKLDVREAVKNLPEEIDETEVLDEELTVDEEAAEEEIECETEE